MKKEIICNRADHNQDEINTVAGTVEFGRYNNGEGITPITWKVLAKDGNRLLIITEYGIDCRAYNVWYADITWEKSTLRKWLNNDFYSAAFSDEEKNMILLTDVKADMNPHFDTPQGNDTKDKCELPENVGLRKKDHNKD